MKQYIILIVALLLLLVGCSKNQYREYENELIEKDTRIDNLLKLEEELLEEVETLKNKLDIVTEEKTAAEKRIMELEEASEQYTKVIEENKQEISSLKSNNSIMGRDNEISESIYHFLDYIDRRRTFEITDSYYYEMYEYPLEYGLRRTGFNSRYGNTGIEYETIIEVTPESEILENVDEFRVSRDDSYIVVLLTIDDEMYIRIYNRELLELIEYSIDEIRAQFKTNQLISHSLLSISDFSTDNKYIRVKFGNEFENDGMFSIDLETFAITTDEDTEEWAMQNELYPSLGKDEIDYMY